LWGRGDNQPSCACQPNPFFHTIKVCVLFILPSYTFFVSSVSHLSFLPQNCFLPCDLCQEILQLVILFCETLDKRVYIWKCSWSSIIFVILFLSIFCAKKNIFLPPPLLQNLPFFFLCVCCKVCWCKYFLFWASIYVHPIFSHYKQKVFDLWVIL